MIDKSIIYFSILWCDSKKMSSAEDGSRGIIIIIMKTPGWDSVGGFCCWPPGVVGVSKKFGLHDLKKKS